MSMESSYGARSPLQTPVDERRDRDRVLASMHNLVAALFRLEKSHTQQDVQQALAPLLAKRRTQEALEEVGEWIVTYDTGEAFLARVQAR